MAQIEDRGAQRFRIILVLLLLMALGGLGLIFWFTQGQALRTALQKPPTATATRLSSFTATPPMTSTPAPTATSVIRPETVAPLVPTPIATAPLTPPVTLTATLAVSPTRTPTTVATSQQPLGSIAYHKTQNGIESILVFNVENKTTTALVDVGLVGDLLFHTHAPLGAWSPDNTRFAYISTFKREGPNALRVIDFRKRTNKALYWTREQGVLFSPAWSPDGKQIAFVEMVPLRENQTGWSIYLVNADGSPCGGKAVCTLRTNAQGEQYHGGLAWSSAGLLAIGSNSTGGNEVFTLFANGWGMFNLTQHPADDSLPAFSPDGTQIAFTSTRDGHYQIYVMDVHGGNLRRLSHGDSTDYAPTWSPDGKWLAFTSVRDGEPNIYLMDLDGNNVQRLTFEGGDRPAWSR